LVELLPKYKFLSNKFIVTIYYYIVLLEDTINLSAESDGGKEREKKQLGICLRKCTPAA
jgi:hypothetical protein